ncbi:hypothetical protein L3Y34_011044 [Caenorhabditis briggsae]|uniref:Major sperm protein n=1 Tax=Caenorhabditis briggsae TaxID=6238 RepID=A0AAE8ZNZ9_CAEBR|nr:hypothetical protein L3Y34_011044 [Caenorhabditis briggsae]
MSDNRPKRVRKAVEKFEFDHKDASENSPRQSVQNVPTMTTSIGSSSHGITSTSQPAGKKVQKVLRKSSSTAPVAPPPISALLQNPKDTPLQSVTNLPTTSSSIPSAPRGIASTNQPATKKPKKEENGSSEADIITLSDGESDKCPSIDISATQKRKTPSSATQLPKTVTPGFKSAADSCSTSSVSSVQNGSRKSSAVALSPPSSSEPLQYIKGHRPKVIKTEFIAGGNVETKGSPSNFSGLGEIKVQPRRMVFNAPYIFSQENRIMISNESNRHLAFRITMSNPHRHFAQDETGIIRPLENFHTFVTCASFGFDQNVIENHQIIIQWTNVPRGVKEFSHDWFEGDGIVGRMTIQVKYSH